MMSHQKVVVDNFNLVADHMEDLGDSGFVYYILIMKRKKDNPGSKINYVEYGKQYFIKNKEELMEKKEEIIKNADGCRVYIKMNKRNLEKIGNMAQDLMKGIPMLMTIKRPIIVHNMLEALREAARHAWSDPEYAEEYPATLIDIDSSDANIYNGVVKMLNLHSIPIWFEYRSPNGGYHIMTKDRSPTKLDFSIFDTKKVKNKLMSKVDAVADGCTLLYANIYKMGY